MTTTREVAQLMARYAKQHHAGAFGAPLARDLNPATTRVWAHGNGEMTAAVVKTLTRDSDRDDWTGRRYRLPKGATVCTFVALSDGAPEPHGLLDVDFVYAYAEDVRVTAMMLEARRPRLATRISASSEIITLWGPRGHRPHVELAADRPTATRLPATAFRPIAEPMRRAILDELATLDRWHDDYPFYSDGTWGAVNLRGFNPTDPLWGVKPAEMPKKWNDEHPDARNYTCEWTSIWPQLATMRAVIESVGWWRRLERVRLMRMQGRPEGGKLGRHTDITDRNAGTRDGQVCRFHIPLTTHPDIRMHTWELDGTHRTHHLEPWACYYLDQRKPHAVANPTTTHRVHLVVDVLADDTVRDHLESLT